MTRRPAAALLALFLVSVSCVGSELDPHLKAVEKIRGLAFKGEVKNVTVERSKLPSILREQMAKDLPYSLDEWVSILRALQLVDDAPQQVVPKLLSLYQEQVLAFYDPHGHVYYSIDEPPAAIKELGNTELLEETVAVHELTHALQDQRFDAGKKIAALRRDTDGGMAYHAVIEGEALLVMIAHMLGKAGMPIDEVVKNDAMIDMMVAAAQKEQVVDASTPPYFAESLKFPYMQGLKFVIAAYRRGGWKELDKVHANPPQSTREILHPEDYFKRTERRAAFEAKAPGVENVLTVERLGQFHWGYLVGAENARGWVDDRVVVTKGEAQNVIAETKWETPAQATKFADAYAAFLKKRGIDANVARHGASVKVTYTFGAAAKKAAA